MADFQGFSQSGSCLSLLSLYPLLPLSLLMVWSKWKDLKFKLPRSACFPFRALFGRLSPALAPSSPSILFFRHSFWKAVLCYFCLILLNTPHTHLFFRSQTQCGGFLIVQWLGFRAPRAWIPSLVSEQKSCMLVAQSKINK